MTPEEQLHKTVGDILVELKQEVLATPDDEWILISTQTDERWRAVRYLAKLGAIKAMEHSGIGGAAAIQIMQQMNGQIYKPKTYKVEILQPKFDEIYKQYQNPQAITAKDNRLPYKKDGLFYSLWKYANAPRLTRKSLIALIDLTPLEGNERFTTFEFLNAIKELGIELEGITFHEEIYKKYCKIEHDFLIEYITKNPTLNFSKAITNLFKNQATFVDIYNLLGKFDELAKAKLQLGGILEFTEFKPAPSAKNLEPLKLHLDKYLQCFIEDKLFSAELVNFYRFSKQKEIFLYNIERDVKDYGVEFVFRQGKIVSIRSGTTVSINEDDRYLPIHILAALEKQGYFEVQSILITDMDVPPEKQTDDYKVKITAAHKLWDEVEGKKTSSPANASKELPSAAGQATNTATVSQKPIRNRLSFFPVTNDIEFNTETAVVTNGHKDCALLTFLSQYKNTPFNVEDIQNNCNPLVNNSAHKFKAEKDVDDTLRQIRFKLKVKKGAYFPIIKRGEKNNKKWIWVEK